MPSVFHRLTESFIATCKKDMVSSSATGDRFTLKIAHGRSSVE
ncbi:hypothetical protein GGQ77_000547 [Geobacillus thermodenitrificans]|nr:hypothetical protein [Geobacillus thermodenitrificans]